MNSLGTLLLFSTLALFFLSSLSDAKWTSGGKDSCQVQLDLLTSSSVFIMNTDFQKEVTETVMGKVDLVKCSLPRQCSTSCFSIGTSHGNVQGCKLLLAFPCLPKGKNSCGDIDMKSLIGKSISTASGPVYIVAASAEAFGTSLSHSGCASSEMMSGFNSYLHLQPL